MVGVGIVSDRTLFWGKDGFRKLPKLTFELLNI
jgi:hypothetical protein